MEKPATIREILGFTQLELALVLNVDRTQVAKYESGQKDLPIAAKYLLADLLRAAQSEQLSAKSLPAIELQYTQKQALLERLLRENKYQLEVIVRKMAAAEKKYNGRVKALQLVDHLNNNVSEKYAIQVSVLNAIARKATQRLEIDGSGKLFQYKLKYQLLFSENMLIQAELRKLTLAQTTAETE